MRLLLPIACLLSLALTPDEVYPKMPEGSSPVVEVPDANAASAEEMKPYTDRIVGSENTFDMLPIPAGSFTMGSKRGEKRRHMNEGPQHQVTVDAFWMGRCEVTWNEYFVFMNKLDVELRKRGAAETHPQDAYADAVTRPTPPYVPMDFEMGVENSPAICMTQFAAKQYTKWLSMKTGRFYRLPTEAEWEYACRAGTQTAYSFGDDVSQLGEYAWYYDNADDSYHEVGLKKPNPWGLHDMHGNVAEWVLDELDAKFYEKSKDGVTNPIAWPDQLYPRVVRGGSWDDDPHRLRSAARRGSRETWKVEDPQLPKSIWYHTDAKFLGFRIVRPLVEPDEEMKQKFWEADLPEVVRIEKRQRTGDR